MSRPWMNVSAPDWEGELTNRTPVLFVWSTGSDPSAGRVVIAGRKTSRAVDLSEDGEAELPGDLPALMQDATPEVERSGQEDGEQHRGHHARAHHLGGLRLQRLARHLGWREHALPVLERRPGAVQLHSRGVDAVEHGVVLRERETEIALGLLDGRLLDLYAGGAGELLRGHGQAPPAAGRGLARLARVDGPAPDRVLLQRLHLLPQGGHLDRVRLLLQGLDLLAQIDDHRVRVGVHHARLVEAGLHLGDLPAVELLQV